MPVLSTRPPNFTLPNDSSDSSSSYLMTPFDRQETVATNGLGSNNNTTNSDDRQSTSPPESSNIVTATEDGVPIIIVESDNTSSSNSSSNGDGRIFTDQLKHLVKRRSDAANGQLTHNRQQKQPARYHKSSVSVLSTNSTTSNAAGGLDAYGMLLPQILRKANSLSLLNPYDTNSIESGGLRRSLSRPSNSRPQYLSVLSITASDSVSLIDNDGRDDDDDDDIGRTSDLDEDMFLTRDVEASEIDPQPQTLSVSSSWTRPIRASWTAQNTFNPIRAIVDKMTVKPNPSKPVISLSIGDPTFYGNMMPASTTVDAVREALDSGKFHGYTPAAGIPQAREAVARHLCTWFEPPSGGHALQADDIFLTHGCSHALDLCLTVLCDSGTSNVLLPRPGFPIYTTLSMSRNVECRSYRLLPQLNFEADLEQMETLIDENTAAIVVTNPANPCGSVYSRQHLLDIVALARRHQVPIIADEIYCDFVFHQSLFIPIGSLSEDVPVLSAGGLTKKYIVPGWRMGWVAIYDRDKLFDTEVRDGLNALCQRILGPCSLIQAALPAILVRPPVEHIARMIDISETNARLAHAAVSAMPGVRALMPQGAMYMMVEILVDQFDGTFSSDVDFTWQLMSEQSVYCLPGSIFGSDNFVRLVLTLPDDKMAEALSRMHEFCVAHFVPRKARAAGDVQEEGKPFS